MFFWMIVIAGAILLAQAVSGVMEVVVDMLFTKEGLWVLSLPFRAVEKLCILISLPIRAIAWLVDYPRKRLALSHGWWNACVGTVLMLAGLVWILVAAGKV
jgi:hypothetical protein